MHEAGQGPQAPASARHEASEPAQRQPPARPWLDARPQEAPYTHFLRNTGTFIRTPVLFTKILEILNRTR